MANLERRRRESTQVLRYLPGEFDAAMIAIRRADGLETDRQAASGQSRWEHRAWKNWRKTRPIPQ